MTRENDLSSRREVTEFQPPHFSHKILQETVRLTKEFYNSAEGKTYIRQEGKTLAEQMRKVEGFQGAFGLGFPYYAGEEPVQDIQNFLSIASSDIDADQKKRPEGWVCPQCHTANNLPDLQSICGSCTDVSLKPFKMFAALPDIDLLVVTKNPSAKTERQVEQVLTELGYPKIVDIEGSIIQRLNVLRAVTKGVSNTAHIKLPTPTDIHLMAQDDFINSLDEMTQQLGVTAPTRTMRGQEWTDRNPPFGFDFIFSLTPLAIENSDFSELIATTRHNILENYGAQQLTRFVASSSPRAARLFKDEHIEEQFLKRLATW